MAREPAIAYRSLSVRVAGILSAIVLVACAIRPTGVAPTPTAMLVQPATVVPPTATRVHASPTSTATVEPSPTRIPEVISNPHFVAQDTPMTNMLGPDGYSWSQAWPIQVDQYAKIFTITQSSRGEHRFVYSNDGGKTWHDNGLVDASMQRGTIAYDARHSIVHVLWAAQTVTDGVIYRRYRIHRDAQHNITSFSQDTSVNLQLDHQHDGTMRYEFPTLLWMDDVVFGQYGALLAIWTARNDQATLQGSEIRATMRILSNTGDDQIASHWRAPVTVDSSVIGNAPAVPYSALVSATGARSLAVAAIRKAAHRHIGDLYLFFGDDQAWHVRRAIWNRNESTWSGLTPPMLLSQMARSGTDRGYSLKRELGTKPVEDRLNDRIYFAFPNWKSDTYGDTWSFLYVDGSDVLSSIVDVYSARGVHSFAPTGDITFDALLSRLVVSYIHTGKGAEYVYAKVYAGTAEVQGETLVFATAPVDIPLLWQGGRYHDGDTDKLLILFRNSINTPNPPYAGFFGTMVWGAVNPLSPPN